MMALSACKIWDYLNPDDHAPYRAVAALISGDDALQPHIAVMYECRTKAITAWQSMGSPKRGILVANKHALAAIIRALQNDSESLDDVRTEFSLAKQAMQVA